MAEGKSTGLGGWIKAGVTGLLSLVSGAALMYVSPLVDKAVKPGKPLANFAEQADGLTVSFHNRSTGACEGWWDFGDGSPLEPFVPDQDTVKHAYLRPGAYTVKLSLRNFVGDENDRTVTVQADAANAPAPVIDEFQVVRLSSADAAPAVFRLIGQVRNADLAIWSLGEDRPLEIDTDPVGNLDHLVTIKEPGHFTLRLVAVNGKQTAEKSQQVSVAKADLGAPGAILHVSYDAVHVRKEEKVHNVAVSFPARFQDAVYKFAVERQAAPGYQIVKADFARPNQDGRVQNLKLEVSPDGTRVRLSGDMARTNGTAPSWTAQVVLSQEMHSPAVEKTMEPIHVTLKVPGITTVPVPTLPRNWLVQKKKMALELRDGNRIVWHGTQLPANQIIQLSSRPCRMIASEMSGQIRVDVIENADLPVHLRN